jgi:hypothetical protein
VTAFSDSLLATCRQQVPDDVPVEVVQFGKLVRDLLALCGESTPLICPSGYSAAAMAEACRSLPADSPFYASSGFPGTHVALEKTLDELRDWGFDAHEMLSLGGSPRLLAKLSSLALLDQESRKLMEALGRTTSDQLIRDSLDAVPEADGEITRILVFAQAEIPPLKADWLRWVVSHGISVTVVLDRHATGAELFAGAKDAIEGEVFDAGQGNRLLNNLFAVEQHSGAPLDVTVASAADPLAEAEWAVRGCLAHTEPMSCAIYARDLTSYAPLIEAAAKRLGLPLKIHRRAPLLTNSFARLTLAALEFCTAKDVRALRVIAQSSYLKLDAEKMALLHEGIRESHRMRALQWDWLGNWARTNEELFPWLPIMLQWRSKAKAGPYGWREWMSLLTEIVRADERVPWSTSVMDGEPRMRERDTRARNRIEQMITDYVSVQVSLGPRLVPFADVVFTLRRLMNDADVSIPANDLGVVVTNQAESVPSVHTLFVLGMLEGIFPKRRSEDPVLTDGEREEMSSLRPEKGSLRTSHDRAHEERDEFYRVCAAAGSALIFSYPAADDNRDNIPAFYLEEVKRCVPVKEVTYPRSLLAPSLENCLAEADVRLRASLGQEELPPPVELTTEAAKQAILPTSDAHSPGELRDALQCPFAYVARRRLKLRPKRHQARWASLRRLPQIAEIASRNLADVKGALFAALDSVLDETSSDVPDWELQLLRSGGARLISDWVLREGMAREKWPKDGNSVRAGVFFGDGLNETMPKKLAKLSGSLAAVSELQGYRVGHLYVSKAPDGRELEETEKLYYGLHFLGLHQQGYEPALEIETMSGERQLMLLNRKPRPALSSIQPHLKTVDLATIDDPALWKRTFYDQVTELLRRAVLKINSGSVEPIKGDHCDWCDYGELCRRSARFSEDDSPFGSDEVMDID